MAETPMPVMVMKAAYDAEYERWDRKMGPTDLNMGIVYRIDDDGTEVTMEETKVVDIDDLNGILEYLAEDASWRAALRALADMEQTDERKRKIINLLPGEHFTPDDYARAYILAAASEGEKP